MRFLGSVFTFMILATALVFAAVTLHRTRLDVAAIEGMVEQTASLNRSLDDRLSQLQTATHEVMMDPEAFWSADEAEGKLDQRLQAAILGRLEQEGLSFSRYQKIDVPKQGLQTVGLQVEITGTLSAIVDFLVTNAEGRPVVALERIRLQGLSEWDQIDGQAVVFAQLNLWSPVKAQDE